VLAVVTEAGIGIVSRYSIPVEVVVLVQKSLSKTSRLKE